MSDEVILNLSFDNQTVTDLTGNWTLDATPNATYEQIEGRDGYSIVTGSLGRCIVLNAVDQNAVYNEYTVDFDMFVKSTYTSDYYIYTIIYMWSRINPGNEYSGRIGNVLDVRLEIGGSEPAGTTDYSPIGRWVHVTLTSGPTEVADQYCTTAYVDGVKLIDRTDILVGGVNPFALSQQIMLLTRDTDAKLMPNGPGICLNTFKVVAGIHAPDQKPAISLLNLSRVFQNFCTWLKGQLSTVALSGSYNDLSDKPTISTVNDGTLTIQKNGTNVATFTANQSTAATANITVPTAVSELTNDSGYLTSSSNLDASKLTSGTVDIERLPQGALERLIKVANEAARYALTTADVQLGDTVQQLDTGIMYVVTDTDHLDSAAGYTEYTAGTAASVPWSGVTGKPTFAAVATSGAYSDLTGTPTIPTVNNATLTIQQNGVNVQTFTANASTNAIANITVPTKTSDLTNDSGFITSDNTKIPLAGSNQISGSLIPATDNSIDIGSSAKNIKMLYTKGITIDGAQFSPSDLTLESLSTNSIPFHNSYPRCKYLGTAITDAQNTAIKNRTYDDLFIGDYWTINGVNWRIVAIDYYYNVGDPNFDKGNIIVMPDTVLYNAQMNTTDTTAGAYAGSLMRTQNLNNARTIVRNAFGSHLANHRIVLANAVDSSGPSNWARYDSDGIELPNEVQIHGTRIWGSALKGFDVAMQKQQFPLMLFAPQFVNLRQNYWLQDVGSGSVSSYFADVAGVGYAGNGIASYSLGVRPSVTLSYI